jgi:hypothetical protein
MLWQSRSDREGGRYSVAQIDCHVPCRGGEVGIGGQGVGLHEGRVWQKADPKAHWPSSLAGNNTRAKHFRGEQYDTDDVSSR